MIFKIAFDDLKNRQDNLLTAVAVEGLPSSIIDEKEWLRDILNPIDFTADLEGHRERFIDGTRKWVLNEIEEWRCNRDGEPYQVLLAGPGFGKTAVVAKYLHENADEEKVLAYHLCFHNDVVKRDPIRIACTLAYQIGEAIPAFMTKLCDAVRETRELHKVLELAQSVASGGYTRDKIKLVFDKLLVEPLKDLPAPDVWLDSRDHL